MDNGEDDDPESSPSESTSQSDPPHVSFAGLLDRINDRRSNEQASNEATDAPTRRAEEDPLESVRKLMAERVPRQPIEAPEAFRRRLPFEWGSFYTGIVLGVVIAVVLPGLVVATAGHVTDTVLAPPPAEYVGEEDSLYLSVDDATYMSRIFSETTHEVAYCGLITYEEANPRVEIWPTPYVPDLKRSSLLRVIVRTQPRRSYSTHTRMVCSGSQNRIDKPSNIAPSDSCVFRAGRSKPNPAKSSRTSPVIASSNQPSPGFR